MNRKKWLGLAAAVALTAAGASFALAQGPGGPGGGPMGGHMGDRAAMHQRMCADMPARIAGRLAYTETKIGITAQQKPAWQKFTDEVRTAMAPMQKRCEDRAKDQAATPPADPSALLAQREQAMSAGLEMVKALRAAYDRLGPSLTVEQKKQLAEMMSRRGHHGMKRAQYRGHDRGHMGGHMGGPMGGPMGGQTPAPAPAPRQ